MSRISWALAIGFFLGLGAQLALAGGAIGSYGPNAASSDVVGTSGKFDVLDAGVLNVEGNTTLCRAGGVLSLPQGVIYGVSGASNSGPQLYLDTSNGSALRYNTNQFTCTSTGCGANALISSSRANGSDMITLVDTTNSKTIRLRNNNDVFEIYNNASSLLAAISNGVFQFGVANGIIKDNGGSIALTFNSTGSIAPGAAGGWFFTQQVGTGTGSGFSQATLCSNTTGVGNITTSGPDDLQVCTIPANTLIVTGRCFEVHAFGTVANNANAKTVRLTIGPTPTAIITKQLNISVASTWKIEATICRTSASNQDFVAEAYNFGGTAVTSVEAATDFDEGVFGTLTQTETNALDIKTQSTVTTGTDDIRSELLIVKAL